jgi:hypothetical protein
MPLLRRPMLPQRPPLTPQRKVKLLLTMRLLQLRLPQANKPVP